MNLSDTGDTQIQLGESGNMTNFYITDDYKLRKMYGYKSFYQFKHTEIQNEEEVEVNDPIDAIYPANFGGTEYLLVASNGTLYSFLKYELEDDWSTQIEPTTIGRIGDGPVSFFTFDKKVYILSGKYHSYDGTTLEEVQGYIPLVFVNTPPSGGGVLYDEINMLSPRKHQQFNGDGTSTVYYIAQNYENTGGHSPIIEKVLINGELVSEDSYTPSPVQGSVTFDTAPPAGMDNVDIYWTCDDGDRHIIENMRFGTVFGGDVDSRVFLYGNPECSNRTYFSGIADDGANVVPSVEYFPATAHVDVGPSNFTLTDLTRQYDRLLATTNRTEAYYLTISTEKLPVTLSDGSQATRYVPAVSTFPLNEAHGNVALGQGQLIDNFPVTIDKTGLSLWKATNVRDEKNMENISQRIDLDLMDLTLSYVKTMDFQTQKQLWFGYDNTFYIYNYFNKTFSRIVIADSLTCYTELGTSAYMGLSDGRIVKWGEEFSTFDGVIIPAHWEMNFDDFDTAYLRKTMRKLWVLLQPQGYSSAEIGYVSNREESSSKKKIEYRTTVFDNVDFRNFSFKVSFNPQPYRLKMKAKKFTNLKITIDNNEESDCTILQLVLNVESFGESK